VKRVVVVYGVAGGLLVAALRLVEYRFLVVEHSVEIYGGLVAVLFASAGIWLGLTLTARREVVVVREVPVAAAREAFAVNEARVRELGITPRELEILQLIARGLSTKEIAAALFVSENTVKTHASRLLDKLGVHRRIKAVETGRALGLIP
jgi:ATP/maltotriose-dependent transcriptional regulator MalT